MNTTTKPVQKYQNTYLVAIILFLVATAVTMIQYKVPTVMTSLMDQLNIGADTASWLMSIFTFVGIFFALPVGALLKKFGPRTIILCAVVLDVIASVVGGFSLNLGGAGVFVLLATRALEGLSLMSVIACGPVVIQLCVDPQKSGTASGIWMLGGMLGATIAGVLTPVFYYSIGFQGLWLAYALFVAVAGVLFAVIVKVPKPVSPVDEPASSEGVLRESNLGEDAAGKNVASGNVSMRAEEKQSGKYRVFFMPNTFAFFVPFAVFQVMLLAVLSFAPTALQQRGMEPALSGLVSTIPMLLAVVSSVAFGALSDKLHRCKPLLIAGMLAMSVSTPIMLTMDGAVMWVALILMGLVAMGVPTVVIAAYPQILKDPRNLTIGMGVLMLVQSLGQFFGSFVPSVLLGPGLSNWVWCAGVLFFTGVVATVCAAVCKFK